MTNLEHIAILEQGVGKWNEWRRANPGIRPHLSGANLSATNLTGVNLRGADLTRAHFRQARLREADLIGANLREADLTKASFSNANFSRADLRNANLNGAKLRHANLRGTNLTEANLSGADLSAVNVSSANLSRTTCIETNFAEATFVRTNLMEADLTGARIYGISAWDVQLAGAVQQELIITPENAASTITVDDLEVAQFIYLLLNNDRLRKVIDTVTSKVVLILGRFTTERKIVLDSLREELRKRGYLPVIFDFEKPSNRDLTETVSTLAHIAKFVIADLTDARSLPQELGRIVPFLPSVAVQPILLASDREWGMYEHFPRYPWVLDVVRYETAAELLANFAERVIGPAERWLAARKPA